MPKCRKTPGRAGRRNDARSPSPGMTPRQKPLSRPLSRIWGSTRLTQGPYLEAGSWSRGRHCFPAAVPERHSKHFLTECGLRMLSRNVRRPCALHDARACFCESALRTAGATSSPRSRIVRRSDACGRPPIPYLRSNRCAPRTIMVLTIFAVTVCGEPT